MSIRDIYVNDKYGSNNPNWHSEDSSWKANKIVRLLRRFGFVPSTVAEVGSGAGGVLVDVVSNISTSATGVGYEPSSLAYATAQQRFGGSDRIAFVNDEFSADDRFYDLVLVVDVLEHVEGCFDFARSLRGRGSNFIFHIPLELSAQTVFRSAPLLRSRELVGHIHYFNKDTALALLSDCGFEIIDWEYTDGSLELAPKSVLSRIFRFPRRLLYLINKDFAMRLVGGSSLLVFCR